MNLLPTAVRALVKGKAPIPYLHPKRPGADQVARIMQKAEDNEK